MKAVSSSRGQAGRVPHRITRPVVVMLVLALGLGACTGGSDAGTEAPDAQATTADQGAGDKPQLEARKFDPLPSLNDKQKRLSVATALVSDPPDDAQVTGTAPGFGEILGGSVEGKGDTLRFALQMSGELPDVMPDDATNMVVAWNIGAGSKRHPMLGVTAQATTEGWQVMAGDNAEVFELPGAFSVAGDEFVLEVSWSALGIPRKFKWSAAATWQTVAGEDANASADNIPSAKFPTGKKP